MDLKKSRFSATGSTSMNTSSSGAMFLPGQIPFPIVNVKASAMIAAVAKTGTQRICKRSRILPPQDF